MFFVVWKNHSLRVTVRKTKQRIQYAEKQHTVRSRHRQQSPSFCSYASPGFQCFVRRDTRADDQESSVIRRLLVWPEG